MINFSDYPPLMTVAETQELLRLGRGKVYDMIRDGEIPVRRLRGAIRVLRDELLDMLKHQGQEQQENQQQKCEQENTNTRAKLHSVPLAKGGEKERKGTRARRKV